MDLDAEAIQKSLMLGRWVPQLSSDVHPIAKLARATVDGDLRAVLTSSYAQEMFRLRSQGSPDQPLRDVFLWAIPSVTDDRERELVQLVLAVGCLHAFVQANWTGPDLHLSLSDLIVDDDDAHRYERVLNTRAIAELAWGGEPAYHLARHPALLRAAEIILDRPYVCCRYAPWWRLRAATLHEHLLDEPVPLPPGLLDSLVPLANAIGADINTDPGPSASAIACSDHPNSSSNPDCSDPDPDLAGRLLLEVGLARHTLSHDRTAADLFVRAARATGLEYELTGALGKRTKFQQNELSQLVLLAESRNTDHPSAAAAAKLPETLPLNDDTLLEHTEFTSTSATTGSGVSKLGHLDPSSQPALRPVDQCILLSLCLNVRNTSPSHGLTTEQMWPYVARVISHPQNWSVHTMALLLRSRLEASRTRTAERSVLQLQALVDQMPTADSTLSERLLYLHSIPLPSRWAMECELASRFLALGVVRSALEIFERLEMWEDVAKCWQAMDRADRAIAIVRDLLEGRKEEAESVVARGKDTPAERRAAMDIAREAKLWCLLGDLERENAVQHYEHAWTLSRETSGRAMRSLGGLYFSREDHGRAAECLERAVAINPLISRSWFVLGCSYVRLEKWEGARDAFGRCVAIDDEDAESWNNLASVFLRLHSASRKTSETDQSSDGKMEAFSNKMMAFRALQRGLRCSHDNWRMWVNYMLVAMDVGELGEACQAQTRVVEMRADVSGAGCVDEDVLERLVDAVTRKNDGDGDGPESAAHATTEDRYRHGGGGLERQVMRLIEQTVLPRVSSPRIFRAHARLLTWQGRWKEALDSHLEAYRHGPAGTFEKGQTDVGVWRRAVDEIEEVLAILANFGPRVEGFDWAHQGQSILRTFVGRTRDFADELEWSRLMDIQQDWLRNQNENQG